MEHAVRYLSAADIHALHIQLMERLGYTPAPLRRGGEGLLESAAMSPRMVARYADVGLVHQAALLDLRISHNQPFVDGNKRTAFIAARVFLRMNGYRFVGDPMHMAVQLEAVALREDSLEATAERFARWFGDYARKA